MSRKILVIDDEFLILNSVEKALTKVGYQVTKAKNLRELAAALKDAPFDLLITDLHMEGDTAENIVRTVTQTSPSVRVLYMSGAAYKTSKDNFIEKPFKINELREKVRAFLDEPS